MFNFIIYPFSLLAGFIAVLINVAVVVKINQKAKLIREDFENFQENVSPHISRTFNSYALEKMKETSVKKEVLTLLIWDIIPWAGFIELISVTIFALLVVPKKMQELDALKDEVNAQKLITLRNRYYSLQPLLNEIEEIIENLRAENFHVNVAEQGYEMLMRLIERSSVRGNLSEQSLTRILQSGKELKTLTQKLLSLALEEKNKNLELLQTSIDLDFDKFDQVMKSICTDIDSRKMIFE